MLIHVVQRGESLWQIAARYGVSTQRINNINELPDPNHLVPGLALVIPIAVRYHTVRSGETLWQIAQSHGTTVNEIIRENPSINPNALTPGMVLIIPPRRYTVQAGDTLGSIAARFNTTVRDILQNNEIADPNNIPVGTVLAIPSGAKPTIEVNAFTYQSDAEGAQSIRRHGNELTYVSPFAYRIRNDGGLEPFPDQAMIAAARSERVTPMMAITNFTSAEAGSQLAHEILSSVAVQDLLLTNIIQTMRNKGYIGLNVDFENVRPEDREPYNRFLQRATERLHREGFFISTSLAPKTSSAQQGLLYEAHDYAAHGRIVDFVVLMTYEWGYRLGPPQAISPLNQIRAVIDYAVTVIPRNKIMMGFQLYARDWLLPHRQGMQAETFSPQEAVRRAIQHDAVIHYETTSQSPYFRYTDEQGRTHEVWFEDARSAQAKFDLVKEYGLRGISYWVLGYPFPQNWVLLADHFYIRKRM
ncbi:MAG: LysM peptidoglycan-binding domain-containing protein [Tuberibacillus sp.]